MNPGRSKRSSFWSLKILADMGLIGGDIRLGALPGVAPCIIPGVICPSKLTLSSF